MEKIVSSLLFLSMFVLCFALTAHGGQKLTIVRGQDFPPYHFLDQQGTETGFLIDIITQVGKALDLEITFEQYPWSRCLHLVKTGQADAMMNLFKTPERTEFLFFANNVIGYEENQFFKLKSNPVSFTGNLANLGDTKIGTIRNYSYGKTFDAMTGLKILALETEKTLLRNLMNQRCDIILGNNIVLEALATEIKASEQIVSTGPAITNAPLYLGFSKAKNHRALADLFSTELNRFKITPAHRAILGKYDL